MAPTGPTTHDIPSDDDLDDILNGVLGVEDISPAFDAQAPKNTQNPVLETVTTELGLDKAVEVEQVKKRLPIPKLDDARLLSMAGIPKLQRISKERLKFKGKGHEYGDIARILNMYQLWLDDLYPRAKFADGLAMIEKLGHSKRIQYMRKEWMNEGKSIRTAVSDAGEHDSVTPNEPVEQGLEPMEGVETEQAIRENKSHVAGEENILAPSQEARRGPEDNPDEDELDALLAESEDLSHLSMIASTTTLRPKERPPEENFFEGEMEAMAEMGDMW